MKSELYINLCKINNLIIDHWGEYRKLIGLSRALSLLLRLQVKLNPPELRGSQLCSSAHSVDYRPVWICSPAEDEDSAVKRLKTLQIKSLHPPGPCPLFQSRSILGEWKCSSLKPRRYLGKEQRNRWNQQVHSYQLSPSARVRILNPCFFVFGFVQERFHLLNKFRTNILRSKCIYLLSFFFFYPTFLHCR